VVIGKAVNVHRLIFYATVLVLYGRRNIFVLKLPSSLAKSRQEVANLAKRFLPFLRITFLPTFVCAVDVCPADAPVLDFMAHEVLLSSLFCSRMKKG
jgi:hypothetical protein